jgi:NosR/NirI family nitrous oxide reductase transcriptional regulator
MRGSPPLAVSLNGWLAALALIVGLAPSPLHAEQLSRYLDQFSPADLVPGAERLGPIEGEPPAAPAYRGDELLGYVFLNTDVVESIGYSGKPIHMAVGLDTKGSIVGTKLLEHHEPIVLIGIPEQRVIDFLGSYQGRNVLAPVAAEGDEASSIDAVSGATVTVLVMDDSITFSARKVARSRQGGGSVASAQPERPKRVLDRSQGGTADWATLLEEGAIGHLRLTVGQVNAAFERRGGKAAKRPERGEPGDEFIDLYVALVSAPVIGRSLLGEREYALLEKSLAPGQQAVLIAGTGLYSWRGSGYVRGGIFDRVELEQDLNRVRFRDRQYKRIGDVLAEGAPDLREVGLFTLPPETDFDPGKPWQLQLVVQRAVGALEKTFIGFDVDYQLPEHYLEPLPPEPPPVLKAPAAASEPEDLPELMSLPALWKRIWQNRTVDIAILLLGLAVLGAIFMFQDWLTKRPRLTDAVRLSFLAFTLLWIGWYANAQLSVVNVLTFSGALLSDFRWDFFLMDPMLFILWASVAVSLLFWGRGPFCGWLCPFGALQEFVNRFAKLVRIPQVRVPWGLHERIWPLKYVIFLGLFGLSLYSLAWAERLSEIEPFKTAIILKFVREWPFVLFAVLLLVAGLFIERFFCRYLCPLGAALAIPGRLRMFEWLKRYSECGRPCQRCANECMVQAIHPEGHINPNECVYCMNCQVLYHDDHRCPVMIQKRLKRERATARATAGARTIPIVEKPAGPKPEPTPIGG